MPWETTAVRDDATKPVVNVVTLDNGVGGVPVPYVYGYPLYAKGDARQGILKLRTDNQDGASTEERADEYGVLYRVEKLPQLGCTIEGFQETPVKFVPISLRCELPAPKAYGGKDRPAVGTLKAGARASAIVKEPSIEKAFLGEWHLTEGKPDEGDGVGYFNTEHGQLAFEFSGGRLSSVAYYFDPKQKGWREPGLWMGQ
jgi:hypothetical protein